MFAVSTAHAQASKNAFSKTEAIIWLNSKMQGAAKQSDVNSRGESTIHSSKFTNCSYYSKLEAYKTDMYKVMNHIKETPEYYNDYTVSLQTLDPSSAVIEKSDDGKFYIKVRATNSVASVTRRIFYPNQSGPSEVVTFSDISFGPFEPGNNLESRALTVVKKVIMSCGGKREAF